MVVSFLSGIASEKRKREKEEKKKNGEEEEEDGDDYEEDQENCEDDQGYYDEWPEDEGEAPAKRRK